MAMPSGPKNCPFPEPKGVKEIHTNYYGNPYSFLTEYSLEEKLDKGVEII